jgi:predicted RNA methylase
MSNPAETYENYMGPSLFAPWAMRLVQSADPQPGERVLDVACGTGVVARRVAVHTDAGFQHVEINEVSMTARFPDPEWFLAGEIDVDTAAIPSMQHLDAQARLAITAAIHDDMKAALREVTKDDHVVIPFHAQIARAERGRA